MPAKPSVARAHRAFADPPVDRQELNLHTEKIKSRMDNLNQLREASYLAGKPENGVDTSEIACLKHMLFMATTPQTSQLSTTWYRVSQLEHQLAGVLEQEK